MRCAGIALLLMCAIVFPCMAITSNSISTDEKKIMSIGKGNVAAGKIKSDENGCQECHGTDGNGQGLNPGATGKFAKLAGQYPDYIVKQIREFRTGERKHELMSIMAKSIDDNDTADIAAHFSSQKKMQGDGKGNNPIAKNLFLNGDPDRNILSCASYHGTDGKGIDLMQQTIPVIGGQEKRYLEKQLQDWRSGDRHNSPAAVMNTFAKQLTDAEIQALTDYISGL